MPAVDWTRNQDWEVLHLAGKRVPGVAHVEVSYQSGIDIQKPKGAKKAKVNDTGTPPADISVSIELLPEEMPGLDAIIAFLRPRAAFASRKELTITHPNCALWGINEIIVGTVKSPQPGPGGTYVLEFSAVEYVVQPKKVKKKPAPPTEDPDGWNVDPLIDELRPSQAGAPEANFSSGDQLQSLGPP